MLRNVRTGKRRKSTGKQFYEKSIYWSWDIARRVPSLVKYRQRQINSEHVKHATYTER